MNLRQRDASGNITAWAYRILLHHCQAVSVASRERLRRIRSRYDLERLKTDGSRSAHVKFL
jgi:hypothetical protein